MKKTLKISAIAFLGAALFALASCTKSVTLHYSLENLNACLAQNPYQSYQLFSDTISNTALLSTLKSAGVQNSEVKSLTLQSMTVEVVTTGLTFSQIGSMQVYFRTVNNPQDSVQIAYTNSIPSGGTVLNLNLNGAQLMPALSNNFILTFGVLNGTGGNNPVCLELTNGVIEIDAKD